MLTAPLSTSVNATFCTPQLVVNHESSHSVDSLASQFENLRLEEQEEGDLRFRLNAVQEEMARRNNLGYGLGVGLGRLLGTRNDNDTCEDSDRDDLEDSSELFQEQDDVEHKGFWVRLGDWAWSTLWGEAGLSAEEKRAAESEGPQVLRESPFEAPSDCPVRGPESKRVSEVKGHFLDGEYLDIFSDYKPPHFDKQADLCRLISIGANARVEGDVIRISFADELEEIMLKSTLSALNQYQSLSSFRYQQVELSENPQVVFYQSELGPVYGISDFPLLKYQSKVLQHFAIMFDHGLASSNSTLSRQQVALHEMGHLLLGAMHPHEARVYAKKSTHSANDWILSSELPNLLNTPDLTFMSYATYGKYTVNVGSLIEKPTTGEASAIRIQGFGFCDTVLAIDKYGPNLEQATQSVVHILIESDFGQSLNNQGGVGVLDARMLQGPATLVLEAGFCPTSLSRGLYYNAYLSDMTVVYSSPFADRIVLNKLDNEVHLTPGGAKTIVIEPEGGIDRLYGFNPARDALIFSGFSDKARIGMSLKQESTHLEIQLGERSKVLLFNVHDQSAFKQILWEAKRDPLDCLRQPSNTLGLLVWGSLIGAGAFLLGTSIAKIENCVRANKHQIKIV